MSRESTLSTFASLKLGRWQGKHATHKPLLVLFALSEFLKFGTTRFAFNEIEEPIRDLIADFGFHDTDSVEPKLPFWHLTSDHVWVVEAPDGTSIDYSGRRPTVVELRAQDARGRFSDPIASDLHNSLGLVIELIGLLLSEHFEPAAHLPILQRLGLWVR